MRTDNRHNAIGIKLRYQTVEGWEQLEALGWNEVGFNFYSANEIADPLLNLKRGLIRFEGSIVWRARNTDDEVVLALLINELLYKKAKDAASNPALHTRLVKLIQAQGMVAEKRNALTALGVPMTDAKVAEMVAKRKLEHPMFRYGVKVESQAWSAIVKSAREVTSVVDSLEKWSSALDSK